MQRVSVVGASGSGKSTLASLIAERCDMAAIELDELYHQPEWEPTPTPEFRARVSQALDQPRWVVAGNYSVVLDLVHGAADTIVWLDLSRSRSTARVVRRSVRRVVRREELWNGNRETISNLVSRDPEKNIIRWAWSSHARVRERYEGFASGKFWAHADVRRLRSPGEVERFVAEISR